ncbi:hypothetical protein [Candidatus Harpocratesius sp.]
MQDQIKTVPLPQKATKKFRSTRIENAPPDLFDPNTPRLGRRESEPHSAEVSYLYNVLNTNFKEDNRVIWDLHHYFIIENQEIDLQFDISFFKGLSIPYTLSSYKAQLYQNRVPTMVINILSKSTWRADVGEHVDYCKLLKIPIYVVFSAYHVASAIYKPPFLRAYILQSTGDYKIVEVRETTINEETLCKNPSVVIDLRPILNFRLGIMKLKEKHEGNLSLYRIIIIKPTVLKRYFTKMEKEKARADQEKARADLFEKKYKELQNQLKN